MAGLWQRRYRRVTGLCIGFLPVLGMALHNWLYGRELQSRFPKIKVEVDRIFIADGPVWTSAGMTAGIDLALGLVERDAGPEAARVIWPGNLGRLIRSRLDSGPPPFSHWRALLM